MAIGLTTTRQTAPGSAAAAQPAVTTGTGNDPSAGPVTLSTADSRQAAAKTLASWHADMPPPAAKTVQDANLWALDAQSDPSSAGKLQDYEASLDKSYSASTKDFLAQYAQADSHAASTAQAAFLANPMASVMPTTAVNFTNNDWGAAAQRVMGWRTGQPAPAPTDVQKANLWALDMQNDPSQAQNLNSYTQRLDPVLGAQTQSFLDNHQTNKTSDPQVQADAFASNPMLPAYGAGGGAALAVTMYDNDAVGVTSSGAPSNDTMTMATLWAANQAKIDPKNYQTFLSTLGDAKDGAMIDTFVQAHAGKDISDPDVQAEASQLFYGAPVDEGPGTQFRDPNLGKAGNAAYDAANPRMSPGDIAALIVPTVLGLAPLGALAAAGKSLGTLATVASTAISNTGRAASAAAGVADRAAASASAVANTGAASQVAANGGRATAATAGAADGSQSAATGAGASTAATAQSTDVADAGIQAGAAATNPTAADNAANVPAGGSWFGMRGARGVRSGGSGTGSTGAVGGGQVLESPTKDGSGRVVLSSVHPEFGATGQQAADQKQFLNTLLNHAAGNGDSSGATVSKDVYIYVGEQHSPQYLQSLKASFSEASGDGNKIHLIDSADQWSAAIAKDPKNSIAVVPGGRVLAKMQAGGANAVDPGLASQTAAVQKAVDNGAGYLGICAGAFIGAGRANLFNPTVRTATDAETLMPLAPGVTATGWANTGGQMDRAALVGVRAGTQMYTMPLFNGPMLGVQDGSRILAHFDDTSVATQALSRPARGGPPMRPAAVTVSEPSRTIPAS